MMWPQWGWWIRYSVAQDDALRAVECIGTGDDDLIADRQAIEHFDFGDAGGAELHRAAFGNVALDHIGETSAFLVDEGASINHQYVVAPIDENAHRQSLALAQAGGFFIAEA